MIACASYPLACASVGLVIIVGGIVTFIALARISVRHKDDR